jgi:hypothetical protein
MQTLVKKCASNFLLIITTISKQGSSLLGIDASAIGPILFRYRGVYPNTSSSISQVDDPFLYACS